MNNLQIKNYASPRSAFQSLRFKSPLHSNSSTARAQNSSFVTVVTEEQRHDSGNGSSTQNPATIFLTTQSIRTGT